MMSTMKGVVALVVILSLGLSVSPVGAQIAFGINAGAALPVSDFGDIAKSGFGGGAFLGTMPSDNVMIRLEGTYWSFTSEDVPIPGFGTIEVTGALASVRLGLRKYWGESRRFFTGPNLGIYIPANGISDLDSKFGIGPQIGYRIPLEGGGSVDITAEFHTIFIGDESPLTDSGDRVFFDSDRMSFFAVGIGYVFGGIGG